MANKKAHNKTVITVKNDVPQKNTRRSDLIAKILSVAAAIALWFYVIDVQTTQYEKEFFGIEVALSEFDSTQGLDIISGRDYEINIKLRGTKAQINSLTEEDIKASVDMSSIAEAGNYNLGISVSVPSGVSIVSKDAEYLELKVDKTLRKSVPVLPVKDSMTYTLPNYDVYEFGDISVTPKNITVSGPANQVEKVVAAKALLDLGRVSGKVKASCSVIFVDENGNEYKGEYIKSDTTSVDVTVPVLKKVKKQTELNTLDSSLKFDYEIIPKSVVLKGDAGKVDSLEKVPTEPFEVTMDNNRYVVRLSLPDDVSAYSDDGELVSVVTVNVWNITDPSENMSEQDSKGTSKDNKTVGEQ